MFCWSRAGAALGWAHRSRDLAQAIAHPLGGYITFWCERWHSVLYKCYALHGLYMLFVIFLVGGGIDHGVGVLGLGPAVGLVRIGFVSMTCHGQETLQTARLMMGDYSRLLYCHWPHPILPQRCTSK